MNIILKLNQGKKLNPILGGLDDIPPKTGNSSLSSINRSPQPTQDETLKKTNTV